MEIMYSVTSEALAPISKRRLNRPELKRQIVDKTQVHGASVAGFARIHGINANVVHRWLRDRAGQSKVAQSRLVARLLFFNLSLTVTERKGLGSTFRTATKGVPPETSALEADS
jgi:transposase-like protein